MRVNKKKIATVGISVLLASGLLVGSVEYASHTFAFNKALAAGNVKTVTESVTNQSAEKTDDSANYNGGVRYMNKIQECVEKLLEVIREDSAYQRYLACEEMLKSNPELKKQIDEFRVAVFHMNNDDTQEDLYDITDEVENRYEKLRKVPEVNAYLEAELDVCRML